MVEKGQTKLQIQVQEKNIDYKRPEILKKFMDSRWKILSRKITGLSAKKQRKLQTEIKKARIMGILPFTDRHAIG